MKNIIIIFSVIGACSSGYLFRMAIQYFKDEQIKITKFFKFTDIPQYIWNVLGTSIFIFTMSIAILVVSL